MWRAEDPQGNEAAKIKWEIVPYTRGRGLDLGCGPYKAFSHFIGVDNGNHARQFGWPIKPDVSVESSDDLSLFNNESMDFVFASHLLEHMEDLNKALAEWFRVVKVGGYLVLYCPDDKLYPKVGEPGANPDHKHNLNQSKVTGIMKDLPGWDLVRDDLRDADYGPNDTKNEYSFFQVYQKIEGRKHQYSARNPEPEKKVAVVRYGAFGDALQASSILPWFKENGYHVTFYCTPRSKSVIEADPHIDRFYVQDQDQVPNEQLFDFWSYEARKYDMFVNLSETVEGALLSMERRPSFYWPHAMRHAMQNVNYWDMTHAMANGCPMPPRSKFYPKAEEIEKANDLTDGIDGPIILWVLRGSAPHKVSLYMDQVLAKLLVAHKDAHIFTVGDGSCQLLEVGWEKEPRVHCMAGKLSIRETLRLAQVADVVVGPETGVLNAVAFDETVGKVVMLSHSSHENLTRDWKNTIALTPDPKQVECYPCHKLHKSWDTCNPFHFTKEWCEKHNVAYEQVGLLEPGVTNAKCAAHIFPDMIYRAIVEQDCFRPKLEIAEAQSGN